MEKELWGRVVWAGRKREERGKFSLLEVETKKTWSCFCSLFCPPSSFQESVRKTFPLQQGDWMMAVGRSEGGETFRLTSLPWVQIGTDRETILPLFRTRFRGKAETIYESLLSIAGGEEQIEAFLSRWTDVWMKQKDESLLTQFHEFLSPAEMSSLFLMWYQKIDQRRLFLVGLTPKEIRVCLKFGSCWDIYQQAVQNPLVLYPLDIATCMNIFRRQKKIPTEEQIEAGKIVRKLYEHVQRRGWTGTPTVFVRREFPSLPRVLETLKKEYHVVEEYETCYLNYMVQVEQKVAQFIDTLVRDEIPSEKRFQAMFREDVVLWTEDQKRAIQGALDHRISLITGRAGTGKTAVIREIIYNLELQKIPYEICSPTGKAAALLRQVLHSSKPSTLHLKIQKSASNKILFQHVLVDEASMVTTELWYQFMVRYPHRFSVTWVGDVYQLPPIEWGSLFSECLKSEEIPTYELVHNRRVYNVPGEEEGILFHAERMVHHVSSVPMKFVPKTNFFLLLGGSEVVLALIRAFRTQGIPSEEITILSPYNKEVGALNTEIQSLYHAGKEGRCDSRGHLWYVGDRVMMTENDYEINIMNGEEGKILHLFPDYLLVQFRDEKPHEFPFEPSLESPEREDGREGIPKDEGTWGKEARSVKQLTLSYALTIHKSQGSEWNYVLLYLPGGKKGGSFLNKNLIYTALTRAKRVLYFIGDLAQLEDSTIRTLPFRKENLALRLQQSLGPKSLAGSPSASVRKEFVGIPELFPIEEGDFEEEQEGDSFIPPIL